MRYLLFLLLLECPRRHSGDDDIDFPGPEVIFFSSSDASEEDMVRFFNIMRGGRRLSRFTYFFVGSVIALMDAVVAR